MNKSSLRQLFISYGLALVLAVVAILLICSGYLYRTQKEALEGQLSLQRQLAENLLKDEIYHLTHNLRNLQTAFFTLRKRDVNSLAEDLAAFTTNSIMPRPIQYNAYVALDKRVSQQLFNKDAFIFVTHRDPKYFGKAEFYSESTLISETFQDPLYQFSPAEIWYHAAKKSKSLELTPIYFDKTYMKQWLISGGLGLYEGHEFIGMVGIDLLVDEINQKLKGIAKDQPIGILLLEESSRTLMSAASEKQNEFLGAQAQYQPIEFSNLKGGAAFQKILYSVEKKVNLHWGPDQNLYFTSRVKIPGTDWQLIIYEKFIDALWTMRSSLIAGALLMLTTLIFLGLTWFHLPREVLNPLVDLQISLRQMIKQSWGNEPGSKYFASPKKMQKYEELGALNRLFHILIKVSLRNQQRNFRQIELARVQEIQTNKMASLGQMASGISHEINNPLAIIMVRLSRLERELERDPVDREKAAEIIRGTEKIVFRIAKIISALRGFSREASQDSFENITLANLLSETLELCQQRITNAAIDLRVHPIPSGLRLQCQPVPVTQVLINVLNNAYDAVSNLKEKWIDIEVRELGRDYVQILIADSGHGISEEIVNKMMDPFFTTKKVGAGIGLGLSISKRIIDTHHGRFFLDLKKPNTTFVIELPKQQGLEENLSELSH